MSTDPRLAPEVVLPVLLKPGRNVYGLFIRDALAEAGFTDMPANGSYVLGLLEPDGATLRDVVSDLGVSKHNAGELVDALVIRGYVRRTEDPQDQRRVFLALTERGRAASQAVLAVVTDLDARLVAMVGPERMEHTKETLLALLSLRSALPSSVPAG
jgi:DNA-binding MarR family transcriptional regulator